MSLKLVVDQLRRVSDDVWEADLKPEDLAILNSPDLREGNTSVLIIKNPTAVGDNRLEFRPEYARVLNLGETRRTIIVVMTDDNGGTSSAQEFGSAFPSRSPFGDRDR